MVEPRCCCSSGRIARAMTGVAVAILGLCSAAVAEDSLTEARSLKREAMERLKRAQSTGADRAAVARVALKELNSARALLQLAPAGTSSEADREIEEINALIYWTRKMMPLDVAGKQPPAAEPPSGVSRDFLARKAYETVALYAKSHADDHFLIAVMYFEVADRFSGTEYSLKAQKLSLDHMQRSIATAGAESDGVAEVESVAPRKDIPSDAEAIAALARRLSAPGVNDEARIVACDEYLETTENESLRAEVTSARAIYAAEDDRSRARVAQSHFRWFKDGKLDDTLRGPADIAREADAFDAAIGAMRGGAASAEGLHLARSFLVRYPKGVFAEEVRRLDAAHGASSKSDAASAWLEYLIAFPKGEFAQDASDKLKSAEGTVMIAMTKALASGDDERVEAIAQSYLRLFRRDTTAAEVRALLGVLSSADRVAEARKMVAAYPNGTLARTVKALAQRWERSGEEEAYADLRKQVAVATGESAIKRALDEFLRAYPTGAHAKEMRLARRIYTLDSDNAKHAAVRKYLKVYPEGALALAATEGERDLADRKERAAFDRAIREIADTKRPITARIDSAENYLSQYPETEGARQIAEAAAKVRELEKEQTTAFAELERRLAGIDSASEGSRLCSEYIARYSGGVYIDRVRERRSEFDSTLQSKEEDREFAALAEANVTDDRTWYARSERCIRFLRKYPGNSHRKAVAEMAKRWARKRLGTHVAKIRSATFSPDSETVVTVDADGRTEASGVWVWNVRKVSVTARYATRPAFASSGAAVLVGGDVLIIGEECGKALVWDIGDGSVAGRYYLGAGSLDAIASAPGMNSVLTASSRGATTLSWDTSDWSLGSSSYACPGGASALAVSARDGRVALGGRRGAVVVRNADADEIWKVEDAHSGRVDCVAFSPEGSLVASASKADGYVCVWRAGGGDRLLRAADDSVSAAFTDSEMFVTSKSLYRARDGKRIAALDGVGPVAASADGRFAFVAGEENEGVLYYIPGLSARE